MKLYKFRSLGDCQSFERAECILRTGKFWCSKFWNMNDPMEGVYSYSLSDNTGDVFTAKNGFVICSFSNDVGFSNPAMWGYYANGFKGLAIEIEIAESDIKAVSYRPDVPSFTLGTQVVIDFLTTKLSPWTHEGEFRFLKESQENAQQIGTITGVTFGRPYGNTKNFADVEKVSQELRDYCRRSEKLFQIVQKLKLPGSAAVVENRQVKREKINGSKLWEAP